MALALTPAEIASLKARGLIGTTRQSPAIGRPRTRTDAEVRALNYQRALAWKRANPEKHAASSKRWYDKNKETIRAKAKRRYIPKGKQVLQP